MLSSTPEDSQSEPEPQPSSTPSLARHAPSEMIQRLFPPRRPGGLATSPMRSRSTPKNWMPDESCLQCYECGKTFHTFRRRHHCRACGQCYCAGCTSSTVDGRLVPINTGAIRVCNFCYSKLKEMETSPVLCPRQAPAPHSVKLSLSRQDLVDTEKEDTSADECSDEESVDADFLYGLHMLFGEDSDKPWYMAETDDDNDVAAELAQDARLKTVYEKHLELTASLLLQQYQMPPSWLPLLLRFSQQAADSLHISLEAGDRADVRHYVKVKSIAGDSAEQSCFVSGLVLRKNVAHRRMRTSIEQPRILLLQSGIQYQREPQRMSSLHTLMQQEEEYLSILISKILSLKPDIIVVEGSVSRLAQEMLLNANVSLVLNVKPSSMQRLARCTGASILSTPEHADRWAADLVLGTCTTFSVKKLNGIGGKLVAFTFFDGCPTESHASILLRGCPDVHSASMLKRIFRLAVHIAYHLRLELALEIDQGCAYSDESFASVQTWVDQPLLLPLRSSPFLQFRSLPPEKFLKRFAGDSDLRETDATSCNGSPPHKPTTKSPRFKREFIEDEASLLQNFSFGRVLLTDQWQCHIRVHTIHFYGLGDKSLGEFLQRGSIEKEFYCGNERCRKSIFDHVLAYTHSGGRVLAQLQERTAPQSSPDDESPVSSSSSPKRSPSPSLLGGAPVLGGKTLPGSTNGLAQIGSVPNASRPAASGATVYTWTHCRSCGHVTVARELSPLSLQMSFGKFLEQFFYNHEVVCRGCEHSMRLLHTRVFASSTFSVRFSYETAPPYKVTTAKPLTRPDVRLALYQEEFLALRRDVDHLLDALTDRIEQIRAKIGDRKGIMAAKADIDADMALLQADVAKAEPSNNIFLLNGLRRRLFRSTQAWKKQLITLGLEMQVELDIGDSAECLYTADDGSVVAVLEHEPGSVIAFALKSREHKAVLDEFAHPEDAAVALDQDARKHQTPDFATAPADWVLGEASHVVHRFQAVKDADKIGLRCTIYCAKQFALLRMQYLDGEELYAESLARSHHWASSGGKSGVSFGKTRDDRFILKYLKKREFHMFLDMAPEYFRYVDRGNSNLLPSVLVPILGAYRITNKNVHQYIVVMPNTLHRCDIQHVFDLKGSIRNRFLPEPPIESSSSMSAVRSHQVLLDGNFLRYTSGLPLPLTEGAKEFLCKAVFNDTWFLSVRQVVDYSILVAVDEEKHELTVGIIDYFRQYTWDKVVETQVKSLGMIAGKGTPTVIAPEHYKTRFCSAMDWYFDTSPDRFSGIDT